MKSPPVPPALVGFFCWLIDSLTSSELVAHQMTPNSKGMSIPADYLRKRNESTNVKSRGICRVVIFFDVVFLEVITKCLN